MPVARRAHEALDEIVAAGSRLAGLFGAQPGQRVDDALADALAQFRRGRVGERDDQDALNLQPALQQQAQVEAADVPGLAGAGRGLDLADAFERAVEDVQRLELAGRIHSTSRHARSGAKTAWALAVNASTAGFEKGSGRPRRASR